MFWDPAVQGKTVYLCNLVLDIYRNCFERVIIFSPSINLDNTWLPVKQYLKTELHQVENDSSKFYYEEYHEADLMRIIDLQFKVVAYMKQQGYKELYQILIIIDDFADTPSFTRNSQLLNSLYIRGRHMAISVVTSTQVYRALGPVIRKNITDIAVFRLRSKLELDAIMEELSGVYDKKTLLEMYNVATEEPYSFLFINLMSKDKEQMFYIALKYVLVPKRDVFKSHKKDL